MNSPSLIGISPAVGVSQQPACLDVGAVGHDSLESSDDMHNAIHDADLENEERIDASRRNMEAAHSRYETTNDCRHRYDATYWRIEWEMAIAKRSPQQVARMQARQVERMQREPGAPKDEGISK